MTALQYGQMTYNLNTFYLLFFSVLTAIMLLGLIFYILGHIRSKNINSFLAQTIVGSLLVFLIFLFFGRYFIMPAIPSSSHLYHFLTTLFTNSEAMSANALNKGYSPNAALIFHMLLPAIALCIAAGCVAERVKLGAFLLFVILASLFIFPPLLCSLWGKGFLFKHGFIDYAGSGLIYLAGATAGFVGLLIVGPRQEKYPNGRRAVALPASNLPLLMLGLILFLIGSFGFNAGVHIVNAELIAPDTFAIIIISTITSSAAGLLTAALVTRLFYGTLDLTFIGNGLIAGLCAITADPVSPSIGSAALIGMTAALFTLITNALIERSRMDDPAGIIGSFGTASVWGLLICGVLSNHSGSHIVTQALGVACIIAWVGITSSITWLLIRFIVGLRISSIDEPRGLDVLECGISAYSHCDKSPE